MREEYKWIFLYVDVFRFSRTIPHTIEINSYTENCGRNTHAHTKRVMYYIDKGIRSRLRKGSECYGLVFVGSGDCCCRLRYDGVRKGNWCALCTCVDKCVCVRSRKVVVFCEIDGWADAWMATEVEWVWRKFWDDGEYCVCARLLRSVW